jgi:hypothetical protein
MQKKLQILSKMIVWDALFPNNLLHNKVCKRLLRMSVPSFHSQNLLHNRINIHININIRLCKTKHSSGSKMFVMSPMICANTLLHKVCKRVLSKYRKSSQEYCSHNLLHNLINIYITNRIFLLIIKKKSKRIIVHLYDKLQVDLKSATFL